MRFPLFLTSLAIAATVAASGTAFAGDGGPAQAFVESEHDKLTHLLKEAPSQQRDERITTTLNNLVDYKLLAHRAFGDPCVVDGCNNLWKTKLTPEQRDKVTELLQQLVEKNYRKNLMRTLDYDVTYKGERPLGSESRVRTEAKSKVKPRDPAITVDYVVARRDNGHIVTDIITEGSSLTRNYYVQFDKMLTTEGHDGEYVVGKLKENVAKP